jgi:hypothetical protein
VTGLTRIAPLAVACLMAMQPFCSNKQDTAGFDRIFEKLSRAKGYNETKRYYTNGTIAAIDYAASRVAATEKEKLSLLPLFNEKTKWEELLHKTEGTRGMVRVRYLDHPSQNMIGFTVDFRMKMENGSWKIDLEDEMRAAAEDRRSGNPSDYIRKIKNKY